MSTRKSTLVIVLVALGFALRIGYGLARYRADAIYLAGDAFIGFWHHDALYHVLIAKGILSGRGYVVYAPLGTELIHRAGEPALFKAPLYQYFLAGVFALSGFSFRLFFPLQSLIGGLVAGFVGLITLQTFRRPRAAWFAGLAAAAHPILVNAASQPYNENLFFFFFVVSIWAFLVWLEMFRFRWAALAGATAGLCMLTRESGFLLLIAFGLASLFTRTTRAASAQGIAFIAVTAATVIAPWTIHNYVRWRVFVPIASIAAADFVDGNNACVSAESPFVPFWAEAPCPEEQHELRVRLSHEWSDPQIPSAVRVNRACQQIALAFVREHPLSYTTLVFRRFWTTLLPFNPRGSQSWQERVALSIFWVAVFPVGTWGTIRALTKPLQACRLVLASLVLLTLGGIAAVLYWSDLRYRVGVDLLLGCLGGQTWEQVLSAGRRMMLGSSQSEED